MEIVNENIYKVNQNKLEILKNGKIIEFPYAIKDVQLFETMMIVLLNYLVNPANPFNENVFGINYEGEVIWQVPKIDHVYTDSPFMNIWRNGANVKLGNWDAFEYTVDPKTGKILGKEFTK